MSSAVNERAAAILSRLPANPVVAEVGVASGRLSERLLRNPGLTLYMVDAWLPAEEWPEHYKATGDSNSCLPPKKRSKHIRRAYDVAEAYKGRAHILHMDSVAAASEAPNNFDLVFLDADHSYDGMNLDIPAWWPKVKPGGYLGGHDYDNTDPRFKFEVKRAVDEYFDNVELDRNFTWFVRK